ncbi:MAG: hypothetical protein A3J38_02680 [Gammaproteobacteria bacterium RIFCSPHIGHO2_12_FULL_45_9]|nr:MAG: hypothetical protein A3J38_02680 [Gammaproteobacteria bacterium RIFCSPHIGHO2_12_FULL_45_9]
MSDNARRFCFASGPVRGEWVNLSESFHTVIRQHRYPPEKAHVLGELLCVAVLLTSTMKFEGEMTVQLETTGAISTLVAKCSHEFRIRGFMDWNREASPEAVEQSFDQGKLVVTVKGADNTILYQSMVPLEGCRVSAALEHYFVQSEQVPTRFWLVVSETQVVGLMLQRLPMKAGESAEQAEHLWEEVCHLTETVKPEELSTWDLETLIKKMYAEHDVELFESRKVWFGCTCSVERMEQAVFTLEPVESKLLMEQGGTVDVTCQYCGKSYGFDAIALKRIFAKQAKKNKKAK